MTLQTIGGGKPEEFVTGFANTVAELVLQILIHKLDFKATIGYEHPIRKVFKNGPQAVSFGSDLVVLLVHHPCHLFPQQSLNSSKVSPNPNIEYLNPKQFQILKIQITKTLLFGLSASIVWDI
jgi:hypothetical protein